MMGTKVIKVLEMYEQKIEHLLKGSFEGNRKLEHALEMCSTTKQFVKEKRDGKAFRWLGFIQGVLWCEGVYTISEMKDHNRPTRDDVLEEYKGHSLRRDAPCSLCGDLDGCHKWRKLEEALQS